MRFEMSRCERFLFIFTYLAILGFGAVHVKSLYTTNYNYICLLEIRDAYIVNLTFLIM